MKYKALLAWLDGHRDLWLDVLRIYLGLGLMIRGIIFFVGGGDVVIKQLAGGEDTWFTSALVAHYVLLAHTAGGAMLVAGLLTRVAALVNVPVLLGAVILHAPDGLFALGQSLEFAAFVLFTLLIVAAAGPGKLSVDYYTFGPGRHHGHDTPEDAEPATIH